MKATCLWSPYSRGNFKCITGITAIFSFGVNQEYRQTECPHGQTQQEYPGLHFSLACRGSSGPECLLLTNPPTALHVLISCFLESYFLSTRFFHHSKYYYIRMHISVPWSLVFYLSLQKICFLCPYQIIELMTFS